jgi:3-hydroxymyristoyl/3-hydroxydecanoyl-(acyl carrier protein) dehydratase
MHYHFTDRILEIDAHGEGTITTRKTFPRTEDYLDGTFRQRDEVPSSLVLETMASAGALLLSIRSRYRAHALLLKINQARFLTPVLAGDQVTARSWVVATQGNWSAEPGPDQTVGVAQTLARTFVGKTQVAEADILFLCIPLTWTFGSRMEDIVTDILDFLGLADARP